MNKKMMCLAISIIFLVPYFNLVACKSDKTSENEFPSVSELKETTVTVGFRYDFNPPDDADFVEKAINTKLALDDKPYKVDLKWYSPSNYTMMIENDAGDENVNLDMAYISVYDIPKLVDRKTLMPIGEYIDTYGQTLKEKSKSYQWKQVTINGKVYALPRNMPQSDSYNLVAVRKDWMHAVGMTEIDTLEDYLKYCRLIINADGIGKGKDINGNEISPFYATLSEHSNVFALRELCPQYYFPLANYAQRPTYIDLDEAQATGKYIVKNFYSPSEDGLDTPFIKWNKFATSLVAAGFMPSAGASVAINADTLFNQTDSLGTLWSSTFKTSERIDTFKSGAGKANIENAENPDIYDVYLNKNKPKYVTLGADNCMGILSKSKNPNEAVDFLNWVKSSQENYDLLNYGVEGRNYYASEKTAEKNGKSYTFKYFSYKKDGSPEIDADRRYAMDMPNWHITDINMTRWSTNLSDDYIISRLEWESDDENGNPLNYFVSPLVGFSIDYSNTALRDAEVNILAALVPTGGFATGAASINDIMSGTKTQYQAMLEALETAKIKLYISELQKQVDAYIAAQT